LIRGVQGNLNYIIIHYANSDGFGSVNKFNDASCLFIDIRASGFFNNSEIVINEKYGGFLSGSFIYNQTEQGKIEISRFSGPWVNLSSKSNPVQKVSHSLIELEVSEEGSNSIILQAELKSKEQPVLIKIDPKLKLTSSSFGSQIKRLNFPEYTVKSGNAVSITATSSSKVIEEIEVIHSNEIEVKFDDKEASHFSGILFTQSGAATIDKQGKFAIYNCEATVKQNICKGVSHSDDIKIEYDEILQQSSYGGERIQAYAFTRSADSEYPSTTILYYFGHHQKIWKQRIDHHSKDLVFSSDVEGNLYVAAILKPSKSTTIPEIPIYKISPENPSEMVLFSKLHKLSLEIPLDREFCPVQLKIDPVFISQLHVLSNCFHDHHFYSSPYIFTFDMERRDYLGKILIDANLNKSLKTELNFCPFSGSFLIHVPE